MWIRKVAYLSHAVHRYTEHIYSPSKWRITHLVSFLEFSQKKLKDAAINN